MKVLSGLVAALVVASAPVLAVELPASAPAGVGLSSRDLPQVPAKMVAEARQAPGPRSDPGVVQCNEPDSIDLNVTPGVNYLVCVAVDHLNRIVVPWSNPVVRTTAEVTTEAHSNVIYVATRSTEPVQFYVLRQGNEDMAVNLTLIPRKIPSREVRLKVPQDLVALTADSAVAAKWEQSQPYVDTLLAGLAEIARGRVPQGYQLRRMGSRDRVPSCALPAGLKADFKEGQILVGANLEIVIGLVANGGGGTDLAETWCVTSQVVAVSFWPRVHLDPGERTEVYIVRRRGETAPAAEGRPSLLGGRL